MQAQAFAKIPVRLIIMYQTTPTVYRKLIYKVDMQPYIMYKSIYDNESFAFFFLYRHNLILGLSPPLFFSHFDNPLKNWLKR